MKEFKRFIKIDSVISLFYNLAGVDEIVLYICQNRILLILIV
jgi:hypothetical protein